LVVDASFVVAALTDSGPDGTWADGLLDEDDLAAPHLMVVEAANILRRGEAVGTISPDTAAIAHADLLARRFELFAYEAFAPRVWSPNLLTLIWRRWIGGCLGPPDLGAASGCRPNPYDVRRQ
jgi:hypothetical protein